MHASRQSVLLFLTPALGGMLLFVFLPIVAALLISFTDFDIYSLGYIERTRIIGLENYTRVLNDPLFWTAVLNTLYFVGVGAPLTILVGLFAALALNMPALRFKRLFRMAFFLPVVTTLIAVAVVWRYLYHPRYGLINYVLITLGFEPVDWLGDPQWAMPALILLAIWKNFGYSMLIFMAGLQAIPPSLYEAAKMDGANWWQQLWHVTIPQLAPTTLFVTVITLIGYFQFFAEPYVMTQGGPLNSTLSIVLYLYQQGFRWWQMGYASAIAFVLFLMFATISIVQMLIRQRQYGQLT